ncbi:hypothetical protein ASPFODRAFT_171026, partial [Aspergillus luchuensis CBS 106.47]
VSDNHSVAFLHALIQTPFFCRGLPPVYVEIKDWLLLSCHRSLYAEVEISCTDQRKDPAAFPPLFTHSTTTKILG